MVQVSPAIHHGAGITSMSVKDVLTSLVDDGMVDTEKIGTSVYFWAFPSKASQARRKKLALVTAERDTVSRTRSAVTHLTSSL